MSIDVEYLNYKVKGLPVIRVVEMPEPFDWHAVRMAMGNNCITVKSGKGYVGLIYADKFLLIHNFSVNSEALVGIADELAEEYRLQMRYMGLYYGSEGFQVSDSDIDTIPRADLKFAPYTWYECYAWAGIVVFVKYSEEDE